MRVSLSRRKGCIPLEGRYKRRAEHVFHGGSEGQRCSVVQVGTHDLYTTRQPLRVALDGDRRHWQAGSNGQTYPGKLVEVGYGAAVQLQYPVRRISAVMAEGENRRWWAEHDIYVTEKLLPLPAQLRALFVPLHPLVVGSDRRMCSNRLQRRTFTPCQRFGVRTVSLGCIGITQPRRKQQSDIEPGGFRQVWQTGVTIEDGAACLLQTFRQLLKRSKHSVCSWNQGVSCKDQNAEVAESALWANRQLQSPRCGFWLYRSGDHIERKGKVAAGTRERADRCEVRRGKLARHTSGNTRHDADAGTVAEDTTEVRRNGDGAGHVRSNIKAAEARRNCSRTTAGRASGGAAKVPGIVRNTVDGIAALPVVQPFSQVRLSQKNGARRTQPAHHGCISSGQVLSQAFQAHGRVQAGGLYRFLQRDGKAEQWKPFACGKRTVRGGGNFSGPIKIAHREGIYISVPAKNARNAKFRQIGGTTLSGGKGLQGVHRVKGQVHGWARACSTAQWLSGTCAMFLLDPRLFLFQNLTARPSTAATQEPTS